AVTHGTAPLFQPCQSKSALCQTFAMPRHRRRCVPSVCQSRARDWGVMATWKQFADSAPDLAAPVRVRLERTKAHVLATVRKDGAPRVSGSEVEFTEDGHLRIGSMANARK